MSNPRSVPRRVSAVGTTALVIATMTGCAAAATQPTPALRPACGPPSITLTGATGGPETLNGVLGVATKLSVDVNDVSGSHVISGSVVVARPGSTADGGDPAGLPTTAAALPANQIATSTLAAGSAPARTISLSFAPSNPGSYPIMFIGKYQTTDDCSAIGTPETDAAHTMNFIVPLGIITVP